MPPELQQKLLDLSCQGYMIKIEGHPYVDGFAQIHTDEDNNICYSSQVFSDVPLSKISPHHVYVYKPIDEWMNLPES